MNLMVQHLLCPRMTKKISFRALHSVNARFSDPIYIDFLQGKDDPYVYVSVFDKELKADTDGQGIHIGKGRLLCEHLVNLAEIVEEIEKGSYFFNELWFSTEDK